MPSMIAVQGEQASFLSKILILSSYTICYLHHPRDQVGYLVIISIQVRDHQHETP